MNSKNNASGVNRSHNSIKFKLVTFLQDIGDALNDVTEFPTTGVRPAKSATFQRSGSIGGGGKLFDPGALKKSH